MVTVQGKISQRLWRTKLLSMRVIILRHGQSTYNIQGRIQGRSDLSVLTDRGREDARLTSAAFQGLEFDAAYASPLQRAQQGPHNPVLDGSQFCGIKFIFVPFFRSKDVLIDFT